MNTKVLACLSVALLASAAHAADGVRFDVKLDEPKDRAAEAIRWPVTVGVPFAAGAIDEKTPIMLLDADTQLSPVQTQVIGRWLPKPGTPQWVLLDFQGDFGAQRQPSWTVVPNWQVLHGDAVLPAAPRLQVDETADQITVNTGAVSFSVGKKAFGLFDNLKTTDGQVLSGSSIYWIDEQGHRYEAKAYGQPKVELELKGPMRAVIKAEGWYARADAPDQKMMRYQVRIAAFAGLPYVRIYHTLIWTTNDKTKMKEFGLSFHLARPAEAGKIGLEHGEEIAGPLSDKALAHAQITHSAPRLAGWAQAGNFGVALAEMSMQLPKAWALYADHVDVQLWAPQAGVLSMVPEDRMISPKMPPDQREWQLFSVCDPQGLAKTHEIWVWPISEKTPPAAAINDYVQRPPVAMADAHYQCSTEAMPLLRPAAETPKEYQFVEDALAAMFDYIVQPEERLKDYDLFFFGDVHLFSPAGWRGYDGGGYNWPQTNWRMFYRSGKRDYFINGARNARHVMDICVCHDGVEHGEAFKQKVVGFTYMYTALPWACGPVFDNFHSHPQYLLHYYHMTGYERAADVLGEIAHASKLSTSGPAVEYYKSHGLSPSRSQYGGIQPACVYYQFTGDEFFRQSALRWAKLAIAFRDANGKFTANTFWNFFHRGIWDVYLLTGDAECLDSLVRLVKDFAAPAADPVTAPCWGRDGMLAFAVAWQATRNDNLLTYPVQRIIDETKLVQTTGPVTPWLGGRGFMGMQRNEYPQFFDGALEILGAWHDAGFKPVAPTLSNMAYLGSRPVNQGGFKSAMTLYLRKEAGKEGKLLLHFQDTNAGKIEDPDKGQKKMEARITGPDGKTRTADVRMKYVYNPDTAVTPYTQPAPIRFEAGEPAGVYQVDMLGQQDQFWVSPKTNLSGLVMEAQDRKLIYKFREEPGRIYFRLDSGRGGVAVEQIGNRPGMATPLRIAGPGDTTLGYYPYPGPKSLSVAVPADDRRGVLALVKGYVDYVPWDMNFPGVILEGAQPWFAVQPDQWFDPKTGN